MTRIGTLYGIGVGPGDPELITLKAAAILHRVSVVFAASSTKNSHSLARNIASVHLRKGVPVEFLGFPMTKQKGMLEVAWRENAGRVLEVLKKGKDAAFITLGDPMTYSTFGYILQTIRETDPHVPIKIIPGITSYQAAAAAAGRVLAEAEESFTVVSGAMGAKRLEQIIDHTDNVVMLKVYKRFDEIMDTLNRLELGEKSVLISRCGLEDEEVSQVSQYAKKSHPPYLSLLIIKK
ncbi:MAG: precorrin-2 C(20)-methyltransferase [Deltaproteobacteria bacterium]|nr:precorrin-2 C(20)-methyltransferase [Deltaproteobacteria bacterium]